MAVLLLVAALVAGVSRLITPVTWQTLYPELSPRASGEAFAALEQLDIPARIHPRTGELEIPADLLHVARVRLAAKGLPRADESDAPPPRLGASSRMEAAHLHAALEQSLAHSIASFKPVAQARVHLNLAKVSPFLRESPPSTAVVVLRLHPAASMSMAQVDAVRSLVAAAVPRMTAQDVRVLNGQGMLLTAQVSGLTPTPEPLQPGARLPGKALTDTSQAGTSVSRHPAVPPAVETPARLPFWSWGIAIALLLVAFLAGRVFRRASAPATPLPPSLDERIAALRRDALANPAQTAEVMKLWLR